LLLTQFWNESKYLEMNWKILLVSEIFKPKKRKLNNWYCGN
jgi:hypothetical protein